MHDREIDIYPSTQKLAKRGITAVGAVAGGIALLAIGALPAVVSVIVGGVAVAVGVASFFSKDPDDKKIGTMVAAGGVLTIVSKLLVPAAGIIGGIGLLAVGVWNGIKFFKGLKSRK